VAIIDHGRVLRSGTIGDIERSLRASALLRIELVGDEAARDAAVAWLGNDPGVADVLPVEAADEDVVRVDVSYDGPAGAQADLLRRMVEAGHRVSGFSQATTDLEEIVLKVTGQDTEETAA
jgi:ABC-type multidrug transport system ATPase subunit